MFFSVNGTRFHQAQPELVKFTLDRDEKRFPDHIRIFCFYSISNRMRTAGVSALLSDLGTEKARIHAFSELAFPPFGYVMTVDGSTPPRPEFYDITPFAQYDYRERTTLYMRLPSAAIYTPYPGDYRARDEVMRDFAENMKRSTKAADG